MDTTVHAKAGEKKNIEKLRKELPPDWEIVQTPEAKKPYYWNKRTNQTSWKFPQAEGKNANGGVYFDVDNIYKCFAQ